VQLWNIGRFCSVTKPTWQYQNNLLSEAGATQSICQRHYFCAVPLVVSCLFPLNSRDELLRSVGDPTWVGAAQVAKNFRRDCEGTLRNDPSFAARVKIIVMREWETINQIPHFSNSSNERAHPRPFRFVEELTENNSVFHANASAAARATQQRKTGAGCVCQ